MKGGLEQAAMGNEAVEAEGKQCRCGETVWRARGAKENGELRPSVVFHKLGRRMRHMAGYEEVIEGDGQPGGSHTDTLRAKTNRRPRNAMGETERGARAARGGRG